MEFIPVTFYVFTGTYGNHYSFLAEKQLDETRFKKWNDNRGGVTDKKKYTKSASVLSKIIDDDVPQAFSHWTYV